jgi:GNAT superfamily N-acetyltransferase
MPRCTDATRWAELRAPCPSVVVCSRWLGRRGTTTPSEGIRSADTILAPRPAQRVSPESAALRFARTADLPRVLSAYAAWGYAREIRPADTVLLVEREDELLGMVRIAPEHGTLVLHGMQVAPAWRRRGVGTRLLEASVRWLAGRECYCVPYAHLDGFYGRTGFLPCAPAEAPGFLVERLEACRDSGRDVTLLYHPGGTTPT